MAGPAPGRPNEARMVDQIFKQGSVQNGTGFNFCPAIAVPTTVKIPEPITAPMPSDVRLSQPSDFLSRFSGRSESEISWSMFLVRKSCGSNRHLPLRRGKTLYCASFRATRDAGRERLMLTAVARHARILTGCARSPSCSGYASWRFAYRSTSFFGP